MSNLCPFCKLLIHMKICRQKWFFHFLLTYEYTIIMAFIPFMCSLSEVYKDHEVKSYSLSDIRTVFLVFMVTIGVRLRMLHLFFY